MEAIFIILSFAHVIHVILCQQYFRVKPHDTSVVAGRTAELHCHVGNRAGLVQWSKDGFLLGYDPEIPGYERYEMRVDHSKSAYTLLVHDARLEDEAEFQCQVGPGKNEKPIRSVARLTVLVPPKFLSINDLPNGSEIEVREAEKVVLLCQALSSKPATILKWYRKNNELMPDASRTTVRREGEKLYSTLSSITLYPKGDTSGSSFTCEALHPALEKPLKTTVGVGVLYPPRHPVIEGYHDGDLIYKGDKLILTCSSSGGKPPADIVWYRNGDTIKGSFSSVGRDSSNTISIIVQSSDNNAVYTCAASNPLTARPLITTVKLSVVFPPKYITIDGPSEVSRGESVTVYCRSDVSNPPAELSWLVDGTSVEPQDTASHPVENGWYSTSNLTAIITRQDMNIKSFTCIAHTSPRHGKVFQTFNVTVLYPPEIPILSGYEDSVELREGDRQSFTCSGPAGNPPAELKWFRGETEVSSVSSVVQGRITSIISFEIEASDNEISVRCEVNNSATVEPLAAEVKLTVLFPPQNVTISVDPLQPREGETVKLECWSGSSNPPAYIQWWKDGVILKDPHKSEIIDTVYGGSSTRSRISVPVSSADHESRFTCEAKNDAFQRSVQEKVTLNVYYAPVFAIPEKVVEMIEGRSGEVNMTAKAYPEVHTYKWSKNGVFVPRWAKDYRESPVVTANGAVLYFNHVSRHDSGAYTCIAQNVEGSTSATLTLNVLYPASVTNVTTNVEVAEGDTTQLECTAEGKPLDENAIIWMREGLSLKSSSTDIGRSVLILNNVTRKDGGVVECVANNNVGHPSRRKAQITVLYRPIILKNLLHRKVATGEREYGEISCFAEGYPEVTFTWSFNGSTINSVHLDSMKYSLKQNLNTQNQWSSTLTIRNVVEADYGVYTCIAGNSMGHDFITFNLVKRSGPESPEGLEALNVSHQSALLVWSPGFDGGLSQTFQLKIRKNQEMSYTYVHIPINSSNYLVTGLSQGALYEISIAAKNSLGESLFSPSINFRTKSLPVMDSTISGPITSSNYSVEFLPAWLLAAAVIGSLIVLANLLVCIIYIRRKRYGRGRQAATGTPVSDEEISREKMSKKIPPEDHAPFYLSGASVDMPDDGLDVDSFQKPHNVELHQVSRESIEDGKSSGRRCDCGGRQWNSTLICGSLEDEISSNQHEQCPDILKRDSCHCHSAVGKREAEVEISSNLGAVMYGKKDRSESSSDIPDYTFRDPLGPPQITLTTFQSKSELPIRHTIIGPKLETVINGHEDDS
ncbi:nephrin-like [Parasteatoda tepidariorum]|uniref:nephrin-like n=1 Tax=Parasteatoda tepidariorum TaxID=114398 RepID=UPI0039BC291B